ncbi:DUF5319 family protein, partial [Actinomadura sp. KC06]|uniref:DUF5319 family protein n=1 Tax=Actinomadura sp. KC06 TaxID=2530369 RepID=UPI001FB5CBBE
MHDDAPLDPFAGDPEDPAAALGDPGDDTAPLSVTEREDVLADLADLEVFRALLEPLGVRGLTVDCGDCGKLHYIDWELLHGNLRHLLDEGLREELLGLGGVHDYLPVSGGGIGPGHGDPVPCL